MVTTQEKEMIIYRKIELRKLDYEDKLSNGLFESFHVSINVTHLAYTSTAV